MNPVNLTRALTAGAVLWSVSIVAAAFFASRPGGPTAYVFAAAVYAMGSAICHQQPERSFHLWMAQLPVCARCIGIYAGAALAVLAGGFWRETPRSLVLLLIAAAPTALTLVYEWTTGSMPANLVRAVAGAPLGGAVALVLLSTARRKRPEVH